jgi:hypothetical protein
MVKGETMNRRTIPILVVLVLALTLLLQVPGNAGDYCDKTGCTPGYWKQEQHFDSWVDWISPEQYFDDYFGAGPHVTLLEALWMKGGGENAFLRHAVAALLNANHPDVEYRYYHPDVMQIVQDTYAANPPPFEAVKDDFAYWNEMGCPLD